MGIFVTGTDTDVGKTLVATWLALHSGYHYYKPIQTGSLYSRDSLDVGKILGSKKIFPESYIFHEPLSPHLAAQIEEREIMMQTINLPSEKNVIIEGAGGVLVPINNRELMIDLIEHLAQPVIIVARTGLGTINHTLLTIQALRGRKLKILGVIMNGEPNEENSKAIKQFGQVEILAQIPKLEIVSKESLAAIPIPALLKQRIAE